MSYEPKTWVCGETIGVSDLNRMENGIANAGGGGGAYTVVFEISSSGATLIEGSCDGVIEAFENGQEVIGKATEYSGGDTTIDLYTNSVSYASDDEAIFDFKRIGDSSTQGHTLYHNIVVIDSNGIQADYILEENII